MEKRSEFLKALDALNLLSETGYKQVDTVLETENTYIMPDKSPSPEELYLKKETLDNLPKESKLLLQLIYNIPTEMVEAIITCPGEKYRGRFVDYVRSHFNWKPAQIDRYLKKLKPLVN